MFTYLQIFFVIIAVYPYLVYPLSLFLGKRKLGVGKIVRPQKVAVIITAFNEGEAILARIDNCLALYSGGDYEVDVVVVDDASTDDSFCRIRENFANNPRVKVVEFQVNEGKNESLNKLLRGAVLDKYDWLLLSDADAHFEENSLYKAIEKIDSNQVGLVGGKIQYVMDGDPIGESEGLYWKLENFIRLREGHLGTLVSCTGLFILVRRSLLHPLPLDVDPDFAIPLSVLSQGYFSCFSDESLVSTPYLKNEKALRARRMRTVIRALTSIGRFWGKLNVGVKFKVLGHMLLRYYVIPFLYLSIIFGAFGYLLDRSDISGALLSMCVVAAALPVFNGIIRNKIPIVSILSGIVLQHYVAFCALLLYARGKRIIKWKPDRGN